MEDTCEAFISVANSKETIGEVINSASNFEISIGKTVKIIADLMNTSVEIEEEQKKKTTNSEVNRLFGCNKKIKDFAKWEPSYSGIEGFKKGLEITIKWFSDSNNHSLYSSDYVI